MSNGITLSAGVRANLLSLQNTAELMQTTQNRLATGKKVNSALDNPISFFTSQGLQSRAGDLNALLDSMSNGIQTIQAANNGLTSITKTVQSMQSTLNQALQDTSWNSSSYSVDAATIGTGTLKNLTFSGGSVSGSVNVAVNSVTSAGTQASITAASAYTAPSGTSYNFTVNGTAVTIADGTTLTNAVTSINSQLSAANSQFQAVASGGSLQIQEITPQGATLTLAGADAATVFGGTLSNTGTAASTGAVQTVDQLVAAINGNTQLAGAVKASNDNGNLRITNLSLADLSVTGASATSVNGGTGGSNTQSIAGNSVRKGLVQQFNTLRDQLDKYATDASYSGINLLSGDNLKLTLNETGTSAINIQAKDSNGNPIAINSTSLGIDTAQNTDFDSATAINSMLTSLSGALSSLRSQGSSLGSNLSTVQNRQDFTKAMINTLQTGADNLVLADTNQEGANLLALQTRQSLSTTALSMASQADQAVLQLFQ